MSASPKSVDMTSKPRCIMLLMPLIHPPASRRSYRLRGPYELIWLGRILFAISVATMRFQYWNTSATCHIPLFSSKSLNCARGFEASDDCGARRCEAFKVVSAHVPVLHVPTVGSADIQYKRVFDSEINGLARKRVWSCPFQSLAGKMVVSVLRAGVTVFPCLVINLLRFNNLSTPSLRRWLFPSKLIVVRVYVGIYAVDSQSWRARGVGSDICFCTIVVVKVHPEGKGVVSQPVGGEWRLQAQEPDSEILHSLSALKLTMCQIDLSTQNQCSKYRVCHSQMLGFNNNVSLPRDIREFLSTYMSIIDEQGLPYVAERPNSQA
ncbi:uncharacterized protein CLUP02_15479 [Colletotrichum lupini]|uniref:Uncharacterized protein n=1 Tax=Colletotrichum lupini TaxID=145971 RepID=A0A9Q8WNB5_9PEZI|nr:uncharacterized protein CLUP02_15479 [Colletotrichum lupini]UQC89948.1 hypothetical protein CLUP02_15479 [Colletotrichum lupini]